MASSRLHRARSLFCLLVTAMTGAGLLPAPTPTEALVCAPKPASAVEDLDYNKFSGDWREILKSKHGPVPLRGGAWRFDFDTNTFVHAAARAGNETCLPPIVGHVLKVLPVGQFQLDYEFFGQPVQETLAVVATDYTSYAILHRCGQAEKAAPPSVCPPDATHVSVLARHVLEEETSQEIGRHLEAACVPRGLLEPHEFQGTEICFLEPSEGFCRGKHTVFYYDKDARSCQNFTFTGCGANENHFLNRQECVDRCEVPLEKARVQPVDSGAIRCAEWGSCGLACPHCCYRREEDGCIVCNCFASHIDNLFKEANCLAATELCPADCQSREASESCFACECPAGDGSMQPALEYVNVQPTSSCPAACVKRVSSSGVFRCHCPSHGVCKLPLKQGSCNGKIPRYFFNITSGFCDVFTYTGCDGNENNFASHEDCMAECEDPCRLPVDSSRCSNTTVERYYFNSQTGLCETFDYGGCEGNGNSFPDLDLCKKRCEGVCSQPQDPGPCYAYLRRFYYDRDQDRCLPFIFGGCLGNGNNFYTSAQCNRHCRSHIAEDLDVLLDRELCHQPLDEGHCRPSDSGSSEATSASMEMRFYYDVQKEQCMRFYYNGCGGNDNNFRTVAGCNLTCFGVQAKVANAAASCPESIECSCGVFSVEDGCKVCQCNSMAVRNGPFVVSAVAVSTAAMLFWPSV
ncbi:papilin-like isoform X2 [Haemaphysalis longicornis]